MNESNNEDNKINKIEKNNIIKSKTFEMTDYDSESRQGSITSVE